MTTSALPSSAEIHGFGRKVDRVTDLSATARYREKCAVPLLASAANVPARMARPPAAPRLRPCFRVARTKLLASFDPYRWAARCSAAAALRSSAPVEV